MLNYITLMFNYQNSHDFHLCVHVSTFGLYCMSACASKHSRILLRHFCPTVRHDVVLRLNECTHRQTFLPSDRGIILFF